MVRDKSWFTYVLMILLLAIVLLPLISMVCTSLKTDAELYGSNSLLPLHPTFDNYRYVFKNTDFAKQVMNSIIVSLIVTLISVITASMAGYALTRFRGRLFGIYKGFLYLIQMIPAVLMLMPLFMVIRAFGLYDNLASLMISYTAINLPICIWMMKNFYDTIPYEIDESALIDGCGKFMAYVRLILPMSASGLTSVGIIAFIYAWNEYMLASVFIRTNTLATLSVGLSQFSQQFSVEWGAMMAASTIATIPASLFLVFAQKYIVQGLTAGAVKG
jgi:ABC-type glycerol-3-phosphate transport system permease component